MTALSNENDEVLITSYDRAAERPIESGIEVTESPAAEEEEAPEPASEKADEDDEDEPQKKVPKLVPICRFSLEELKDAFDRFMKTKALPGADIRPSVVDYARKQNLFQLMQEDYDAAQRIEDGIEVLMESLRDDYAAYDCELQQQMLRDKMALAEEKHRDIQEEYADRIARFKERENSDYEQLLHKHEQARIAFEAEWSRPEAVVAFNKPSVTLLQVRRMQKALAISRHFAQAKQIKVAADVQQKEETALANRRARDTMKVEYAQLLRRQEREVECFLDNSRRQFITLEAERDARLKANDNMRNQLENRSKWRKHPRRPTVTLPQVGARYEPKQIPGLITTRTRSQFATFKKAAEKTRLDVSLGDVTKITKPMTPTPRKGQKKPVAYE
jgi:hypothetical protein